VQVGRALVHTEIEKFLDIHRCHGSTCCCFLLIWQLGKSPFY
jgi:hypothetical protein